MKKVAFIGSYDKTDLVLCIGKTLVNLGQKVLVIDATVLQKTRFLVPTMKALKQYITTYENVDVAIGFESLSQILAYKKQVEGIEKLEYDTVLIDIDSYRGYYYYGIKTEDKQYFVTSFDVYNIKRGLQIFKKLTEPVNVTKVLFTHRMDKEEDDYLNYVAKGLKINWNQNILFFPFETSDLDAIFANQRTNSIQLRGLSNEYIDGVSFISEDITGESQANVRKAIKGML